MAPNHGEAGDRPSGLIATSDINGNSQEVQEASSSSNPSLHKDSKFKDPHQTIVEVQVAPSRTNNGCAPATVPVIKRRACIRCRRKRIGCDRGAPCGACVLAGVLCNRPLQSAPK